MSPKDQSMLSQRVLYHVSLSDYYSYNYFVNRVGMCVLCRLTRVIAYRWSILPPYGKEFYRQLAEADSQRYNADCAARMIVSTPGQNTAHTDRSGNVLTVQ